jgi:hypothetical protein
MRRFALILALIACDERPLAELPAPRAAPAFKASCTIPRLSVCTEYSEASFALGEEVLKSACQGNHGTWSPARCPAVRRLGSCALSGSRRVYYPEFSAVTAAKDCTELYQGSWAAN